MNRIPTNWHEEREDSYLDAAIEAIISQPIDVLAVERVTLRAQAIPAREETTTHRSPVL